MHIHCTHKRALTLLCALALIFLLPGTGLGVSGWGNAPERNTNSNTEPHSGQRTTEDSQSKSESGTVDETTIPVPGSGSKAPKAAEADTAQVQPGRSSERVLESKSTSESERRTDTERKETIIVPEERRQDAAQPQEGPAQGGNREKERITRESTNSEKDKASLREETRIIAPEQAGPKTQNQGARQPEEQQERITRESTSSEKDKASLREETRMIVPEQAGPETQNPEARPPEEQQKGVTEERRQADREEKTRQEERTTVPSPAEAGRAKGGARGKGVYLRELIPLTRMPPKDNGEAAPEEAKADGSAQPAERPAQPGEEKEAAKLEDTRKKAVPSEAGQKEAKGNIEKAKAERAREEPEQTKAEKGKTEKAPAQPAGAEKAGAERGKAERKNARPKIGEPLRIPPEAVKTGNLDFLEGCWQGTRPEYYSKRTVEECFCFGPGGQTGKRRIIDPAGGRSCIGATRANLNKNGVLSVTSQKGYCDDGVNWGQAEMLCHGEGQSTPCSWVFRDAQGGRQAYRIPFVRVRACGR